MLPALNADSSQRGCGFTMSLYDPGNSLSINQGTAFGSYYSGYATNTHVVIAQWYMDTTIAVLTSIRFSVESAGNLSGVFKLYGVAK